MRGILMYFTLTCIAMYPESRVIAMGKIIQNYSYLTLKRKQVFLTENGVKIPLKKCLFV